MGRNGIDLHPRGGRDYDSVRLRPDREGGVHSEGGVRVNGQIRLSLGCESVGGNSEIVVADRKIGEGIEALPVGNGSDRSFAWAVLTKLSVAPAYDRSGWVCDCPGDAAAGGCPQRQRGNKKQYDGQTSIGAL